MSVITQMIIALHGLHDPDEGPQEIDSVVPALNAYLRERLHLEWPEGYQFFARVNQEAVGGNAYLETELLVGCNRSLPFDMVFNWLRAHQWVDDTPSVQIIYSLDQDIGWRILDVLGHFEYTPAPEID
jgi:hypothetical protein